MMSPKKTTMSPKKVITSPKKATWSTGGGSHHKGSDAVPDIEDLGKELKTLRPRQKTKSNESQNSNEMDCKIHYHKGTRNAGVQTSSEVVGQGSSKSGQETQNAKDQGMMNPTEKPVQKPDA